jgi:hypothetical protein
MNHLTLFENFSINEKFSRTQEIKESSDPNQQESLLVWTEKDGKEFTAYTKSYLASEHLRKIFEKSSLVKSINGKKN